MEYNYPLHGEDATLALGSAIATHVPVSLTVYLHGDLGAGKTTWVRGFLRGLGHLGKVKSPTYTLVEPYPLTTRKIFHFDLYRLNDADELEDIGIRDYFRNDVICLIEWPERGAPLLPAPDIEIWLEHSTADARNARVFANTEVGKTVMLAVVFSGA